MGLFDFLGITGKGGLFEGVGGLIGAAAPVASAIAPAVIGGANPLATALAVADGAGAPGAAGVAGAAGPIGVAAEMLAQELVPGTTARVMAGPGLKGVAAAAVAASRARLPALVQIANANGIFAPLSGTNIKVTVVFTIGDDGAFIKSVERGRPLVMSRDTQRAKRVSKTVRKIASKMPVKHIRETLSQEIVRKAKEAAVKAIECPPRQLPPGPSC